MSKKEAKVIERLRNDEEYYGTLGRQYISNSDIQTKDVTEYLNTKSLFIILKTLIIFVNNRFQFFWIPAS